MIPTDPIMLLSFVNLKLRDEYASLDEMCDALLVDRDDVVRRLESVGYRYNKELNQFK